mmetsp:Transcript_48189/g.82251  ORF Transcript_48189/g.82251 Transcript_48189/m.82251 type:complete len:220 (-) Transcript_48189:263-922(-)
MPPGAILGHARSSSATTPSADLSFPSRYTTASEPSSTWRDTDSEGTTEATALPRPPSQGASTLVTMAMRLELASLARSESHRSHEGQRVQRRSTCSEKSPCSAPTIAPPKLLNGPNTPPSSALPPSVSSSSPLSPPSRGAVAGSPSRWRRSPKRSRSNRPNSADTCSPLPGLNSAMSPRTSGLRAMNEDSSSTSSWSFSSPPSSSSSPNLLPFSAGRPP